MITLSIQSSKYCVSAALFSDSKIIKFSQIKNVKFNRIESLMKIIEKLLKSLPMNRVDLIIFPRGPGSFTTIRSLISTSQGLALGYGAKIRTVSNFEAIFVSKRICKSKTIVIFKDSREEFLHQIFEKGSNGKISNGNIEAGNFEDLKIKVKKSCPRKEIAIISDHRYAIFSDPFFSNYCLQITSCNAKKVFLAYRKGYSSENIEPIYFFRHYAFQN